MCRRVTCSNCQKPSWVGCGAHIEQVLGDVAVEDRCACSADDVDPTGGRLRRFLRR